MENDLRADVIGKMNIHGFPVELRRWIGSSGSVYNAYCEITNSRFIQLPEGTCTYRDDDVFGVDTAKSWQERYSDEQKLLSAIRDITELIEICMNVLIIEK